MCVCGRCLRQAAIATREAFARPHSPSTKSCGCMRRVVGTVSLLSEAAHDQASAAIAFIIGLTSSFAALIIGW
jgi:hypothetical protein